MKKATLAIVALSVAGLFAFRVSTAGSISGKVNPANGANEVFAVAGTDTLKVAVSSGAFTFQNVKAGTYTVIIDGIEPYKDKTIPNVSVVDDQPTDLGEITLEQ